MAENEPLRDDIGNAGFDRSACERKGHVGFAFPSNRERSRPQKLSPLLADNLIPGMSRSLDGLLRTLSGMHGCHSAAGFFPYGPIYFENKLAVVFSCLVSCRERREPEVYQEALPRPRRANNEEALEGRGAMCHSV